MKILITGGAGFIGSATAKQLIARGEDVVLIDNFNNYYDPQLKRDRIKIFLKSCKGKFILYTGDIRDVKFLERVFKKEKPDKIIHLAAMAGVRNSLEHPALYADVNVMGTINMLDLAVKYHVKNFVYASSSSVYGNNKKVPFVETDSVDMPISPYAATKKANELLAHVYSHIYALPTTGLRFFTVYGPWGRPDMAPMLFAKNIFSKTPIIVNNYGKMSRNFTYIDDIVSGILVSLDASLPYAIMNIGGDRENTLLEFIASIEKYTGRKAKKKMMPLPPGDMISTVANIKKMRALGWKPTTRLDQGIQQFMFWYREYFHV
ncbi:MAG: SDR family NAD(P)-dependent oxidoreductase [Minisyncoccota bacterium]